MTDQRARGKRVSISGVNGVGACLQAINGIRNRIMKKTSRSFRLQAGSYIRSTNKPLGIRAVGIEVTLEPNPVAVAAIVPRPTFAAGTQATAIWIQKYV